MLDNPPECRRNALACVQASPSPEAKEHFAELARTWLRLAGDLKSGQALVDLLDDFEPQLERGAG
jgi:ubiquinone biosynthesis protein UbiJ